MYNASTKEAHANMDKQRLDTLHHQHIRGKLAKIGIVLATSSLVGCGVAPSMDGQDGAPTPLNTPSAGSTHTTGSTTPGSQNTTEKDNSRAVVAYIQSDMTNKDCIRMGTDLERAGKRVTRWIISQAVPTTSAGAAKPKLKPACAAVIGELGKDAPVSLAVGGWHTRTSDHQAFLTRWDTIMAQPAQFSSNIKETMNAVEAQTGARVSGIDLDYEFPTADKTQKLDSFVSNLRQVFPQSSLSMTVDCNAGYPDSFKAELTPNIVKNLNFISVMAYARFPDTGSRALSSEAAPYAHGLAPAEWSKTCVQKWVGEAKDPSKILFGVPAYGMAYPGAGVIAGRYTSRHAIMYKDINTQAPLTKSFGAWSSLQDGAVTSYVPAAVLRQTVDSLEAEYPTLGGTMIWPAGGVNQEFMNAVEPK